MSSTYKHIMTCLHFLDLVHIHLLPLLIEKLL